MSDRGKFVWILHCPACHDAFSPIESDWDGDIICGACGYVSTIDHNWYDHADETEEGVEFNIEIGEDEPQPKPGDHPDWPSNLSDELLDKAWAAADLMPDRVVVLMQEYQRRGRTPPGRFSA